MMAYGFMEIVMLALLSSGQSNTDLIALIQPKHYFASRDIEVSIDKMMELASNDPKDAKTQVMQLTALRYLTEESDGLKKSPKYEAYRKTLDQIALGKIAQDPLDFAKDYASRLLAKLDGTKIKLTKAPLLREDAIAWFPADASLLFAFELRQVSNFAADTDPLKDLLKIIPDRAKKEMYEFIEKAGNVRLERFAFAMNDTKDGDFKKLMMRFTGKANQTWLAEAFKSMPHSNFEVKYMKDPRGTPVTVLQEPNRPPIMALVGNTDLLIVGYERNYAKQMKVKGDDPPVEVKEPKHMDVLDEVILVREKKKPSAVTGVLKTQLAKVPDNAMALLVGDVPENMKREFRALDAVPTKVAAHVVRDQQGLDVVTEATMANEADAGKLVAKIGMLRKDGIAALQKAQQQPLPQGFPPVPFASLINLLEGLQVQSKTDKVQVRVLVPEELMRQMGTLGMGMFGMMAAPARVAPAPVPNPVPPVEVPVPKKAG